MIAIFVGVDYAFTNYAIKYMLKIIICSVYVIFVLGESKVVYSIADYFLHAEHHQNCILSITNYNKRPAATSLNSLVVKQNDDNQ